MPILTHRRAFLAGLAALLSPLPAGAADFVSADSVKSASERIAALEARAGGRLGVFVLDTASGLSIAHRSDERFPMCSTFKLLTAAAVLALVDAGSERLDRKIPYGTADLLEYAPVTKAHAGEGAMSLGDLCAAAIDWSDNTAANLLLQVIGGPPAFTRYVRALGDELTRLDRNEPTLNTAIAGDERDTTTPAAMVGDMRAVLLGDRLSPGSRRQLETWLIGDRVGDKRIRAGLPPSWRVGDKTGTGDNGTANVIAIIRPPDRAPLLAASYYTGSSGSADALNAVHKEVGGIVAATF
ncbi:MAG TPA: class A beta-lactamase [Roseiarcus sp.]|jgi:beta-lactamase class A